ncbi:MAG: hypothetical protein INQ03_02555 [Candidatus Heimdallarchaeota archaeon]|nr:hypothetical protein [Candidatus Heimdallarchaeota archaeon]
MSEEYDEFEDLSMDLDTEEVIEPDKKKVISKNPTKGSKISVYFQSTIGPSQRQEKMLISLEAPVADIKYTVSQIFSLPADEFHLSYAGRTLDPDDIISNYDVEEGDTLLLIPISIAG